MGRKRPLKSNNCIEISTEQNEELIELCSFDDALDMSGTPIASFNFSKEADDAKTLLAPSSEGSVSQNKISDASKEALCDKPIDNRTLQLQPNGITPPVDGEYFVIKRTFAFRRSTVRILNQLKACHPSENAYLSSIVDAALRHYYNYIFNDGGKQV